MNAGAKRRVYVFTALAVGAALAVTAIPWALWGKRPAPTGEHATRGPFALVVRADGELRPTSTNAVRARDGVLARLVENGQSVRVGDELLAVDCAEAERSLRDWTYRRVVEQAQFAKTRKETEKQIRAAERNVIRAQRGLDYAKKNRAVVEAKPDPVDIRNAEERQTLAERVAQSIGREVEILRDLARRGYVAPTELAARELDHRKAVLDVETSRMALEKVRLGAPEDERVQARLDVESAQADMENAEYERARANDRAQGRIQAHEASLRQIDQRIQEQEEAIRDSVRIASIDGLAVHAPGHWGNPWSVGQHVSNFRPIVTIARPGEVSLQVQVDGRDIDRVQKDCRVRVHVRAMEIDAPNGNAMLEGRVTVVGRRGRDAFQDLDNATRTLLGDAGRKVFDVDIELLRNDPQLKSGLGAEAEIVVYESPDAVTVPKSAVLRDNAGHPYVRLWDGKSTIRRPVTLGVFSEDRVQVMAGLQGGEFVVTEPPEEELL